MSFDIFTFKLAHGSHKTAQLGTCFMEAVAWMADEEHSDAPACACPVLGRFGIRLNDRMTDDERKLLNPLILKMMNTRSKGHEELRAAHLLRGVGVRILAPLFDARGWDKEAAMLRGIPEGASRKEMLPTLREVRDLSAKKRSAAADAAAYAAAAYAYDAAYAAYAAADYAADAAYAAYAAYAADAAYAAYAAYAADAAHAADAAAAFRKLWAKETVALLNEAIQIGPHNSDEFYDIARVVEFREKVLAHVGA